MNLDQFLETQYFIYYRFCGALEVAMQETK